MDRGVYARLVLRIADAFRGPLRRMGVDPVSFRSLLDVELALERRRAKAAASRGEGSAGTLAKALSFGVNTLVGGIGAIALGSIDDPLWGMGLAQLLSMSLLTMVIVTDYLPALLDAVGIEVLAPLPVDGRAVLAARVAHMLAYLGFTVLALSVVPLIVGTVRYGLWPFVPAWLLATLLTTTTSLGLSLGLFLLAMRAFDPGRFKNVLLYAQIGFTAVFFGGFQILPRIVDREALQAAFGSHPWWLALLPPFHVAAFLPIAEGASEGFLVFLAVLGFYVPIVCIAFTLALARRGFVAGLTAMATATRGAPNVRRPRRPLRDLLLRDPIARTGYDLFAALSVRERGFRMRTYTMIAMSLVFGIAFALRRGGIEKPEMLCGVMYFLCLYAPMFVLQSRFSDDYEARWLFTVAPVARFGPFLKGALTALLTTFVLPVASVFLILIVAIGGPVVLPDAAFALGAVILLTTLSMVLLGRYLPFTQKQTKNPNQGHIGKVFLMMGVTSVAIGAHTLLRQSDVAFYSGLLALPMAIVFTVGRLGRVQPEADWQER